MSIKLKYDSVKNFIENSGCELIGEYKNSTTKIKIKCRCGKIS